MVPQKQGTPLPTDQYPGANSKTQKQSVAQQMGLIRPNSKHLQNLQPLMASPTPGAGPAPTNQHILSKSNLSG